MFLLRFLRARKFNVSETLKMFKSYLEFHKNVDIDKSIINKDFSEKAKLLLKYYPRCYHKTDKQGRPIYIELISKVKFDEVFNYISEEDVLNVNIKEYENYINHKLTMCSKSAGIPIEQSLTLLCVKDVQVSYALKVKKFLGKLTHTSQNYYPELLGHLFILNSNSVFKTIWYIIKGFIDERTKKKITIEGSDYLPKLLELIDIDNLPSFFGGNCNCLKYGGCIQSNIGPWNPEE